MITAEDRGNLIRSKNLGNLSDEYKYYMDILNTALVDK